MSAIMRPRRSLIGLSLIEGSCPELEFGTLNPQDGTPAPSSPVDQLARSSPLAPLRAQRTPARAGSFIGPTLTTSAVRQVVSYQGYSCRDGNVVAKAAPVEWPGGLSPPGSPRTVRGPLDSYGSCCSAVSMTQLAVSEELRICTTQLRKPIPRPFGLVAQPFELPTRPADDIDVDPLQGRTQLRPIEVAVVVDPALNVRIVHLGQFLQGLVAAMMKRPPPNCLADGLQR